MISRRQLLAAIPTAALLPKLAPSEGSSSPDGLAPLTLLLVDDHDVLYRPGTRRVPHPLIRHAGNPIIKAREQPWEVAVGWNSVHRNPDTGTYQLWYQAYSGDLAKEKTKRCVVCYAESKDGLQWVKPPLELYSYNDIRATNIVLVSAVPVTGDSLRHPLRWQGKQADLPKGEYMLRLHLKNAEVFAVTVN